MLDRIDGDSGESRTRREAEESIEQRSERVVAEGLARSGWDEQRLETERNGRPAKVRVARMHRAKAHTTKARSANA